MTLSKGQIVTVFVIILASPIILWLLMWLSILLSPDVYEHPLSETGLWPIVCSTRGCITTSGWHKHWQSRLVFAKATGQDKPTPEDALTTLARQYLVDKALFDSPVTLADARRYREEVLMASDEDQIVKVTGLSIKDYDKFVILPLLKQEVLRQQRGSESLEKLFVELAQERPLWVLPRGLKWDRTSAKVVRK